MEFNVMSFGAIGNGIASDTQAIQAAIDACRQNGGGRVVFPAGRVDPMLQFGTASIYGRYAQGKR